MTRRTGPALVLPLVVLLSACGGGDDSRDTAPVPPAGGTPAAEADARALSNYRLNEADLRRWAEVMRSPEQRGAVEDQSDDDDGITPLATRIENNPEYRAAVERAGLTPTRFAIISNVLIFAVGAHEMGKAGMDADSIARENGIHPANVGFVAEHEDEIRPLLQM